ncbi:MAG TPA: hypothetical protein VL127_07325 [Bryobacteraceae bacterium]|jgi:hypothetical protein|nr:hypothetical protein [Bryobacteraceae bacterium]
MRCQKLKFGIVFAGVGMLASAQWLNYPTPGTPRTKDGKPNLSAPTPRAANGKPDLSGVWQVEPPAPGEMERKVGDLGTFVVPGDDPRTFSPYFFNILADFKPEEAPIRPQAAALFQLHARRFGKDSPGSHCLPMGVPNTELIAVPFKIIQTPGVIAMLLEVDNSHRQIYTDGRPLPVDPQPSWQGYSVGKWEGDTLVVDSAGFNDKSWLDAMGHIHSEALRVQERYRRRDFGHMELQVTIDDPKTFTKPFTFKVNQLLIPDSDILETICTENEQDRAHLADK